MTALQMCCALKQREVEGKLCSINIVYIHHVCVCGFLQLKNTPESEKTTLIHISMCIFCIMEQRLQLYMITCILLLQVLIQSKSSADHRIREQPRRRLN